MERVPALGEQAQHLFPCEVGEADGALEAVAGSAEGGEAEAREGLDDGLVDASQGGLTCGVGSVQGEATVAAALEVCE